MLHRRVARASKIVRTPGTAATAVDATSADVVAAEAVVTSVVMVAEAVAASADLAEISPLRSMLRLVLMRKIPPSPLQPRATYP